MVVYGIIQSIHHDGAPLTNPATPWRGGKNSINSLSRQPAVRSRLHKDGKRARVRVVIIMPSPSPQSSPLGERKSRRFIF